MQIVMNKAKTKEKEEITQVDGKLARVGKSKTTKSLCVSR